MDQIEGLYDQSVAVKNEIISANLRLVVSIAKRHVSPGENFFELVSDGNISLIRAVEKFDYARGNKFSTYASWAIMKNYARTIPDELRHRDRIAENVMQPDQPRRGWFDDQPSVEQTHVMAVARPQHGAMLPELHRPRVVVDGGVMYLEPGHEGAATRSGGERGTAAGAFMTSTARLPRPRPERPPRSRRDPRR